MRFIYSFTLLILLLFCVQNTQAQEWDYEKFPRLDVELQHLDADIRISEDGFIEGDVLYNARFMRNHTDSLVFHAARMNIISVSVNDEVQEYRMDDDRLIIDLEEEFSRNEVINIRIQYDTSPSFGVHRNSNGTIWTSLLPKSVRHWLPTNDHPRVAFTTDIIFTHPSGKTMIASGERGRTEVLNVDEEQTSFESANPVPVTALSWATGEVNEVASATVSDSRIFLYSESGQADEEYLQSASGAFRSVLNELGVSYPYQDLHIVMLEEDYWETKPYGAGMVFVYKNKENFSQQIQRGILAQWAGVLLREEQWSDADAVHLLQAELANRLFDFEYITDLEEGTDPYDRFSQYTLSLWQKTLSENQTGSLQDHLEYVNEFLFSGDNIILGWHEFASALYEETGVPYFDRLSTVEMEIEPEQVEQVTEYIARVEWTEGADAAEIHFESIGTPFDELVTVRAEEITINDVRSHELTFSGQSDGVVINVSSGIENIKLYVEDNDELILHEEKPFLFWIHQLRNDEDSGRRAEAARGLAQLSDNPDLQLALNDVLQMESNPEVYAEIIRSMSRITAGASGTDERFLQYSSSNQNPLIQKAAVEALAYFRDNDRVISRLRTIIVQTTDEEIRREAIRSLYEVTDGERFSSQVEYLVTQESVLNEISLLLDLLAQKGEAENAVEFASTFIAEEFPFATRKGALDIMLQYDESPSNWQERLPELLTDRHPRIRHHAALALDKLSSGQRNAIVADRIDDEFDERIRQLLE